MRSRILLCAAALCLVILAGRTAYACSCATGDPPFEFNRAKAIFIGRMLGGTEKISLKDDKGKAYTIEAGTVRFAIEESFKGDLVGQVPIEIDSMKGTSCGPYGLKRGIKYLVYAYASEAHSGSLYTGVCTRTSPINSDFTKQDLDFLRNLPPPGTGGNIRGSIWADLRAGGATPLPNLKVSITGSDNQSITAFTDERGEFEVKLLKPGKYKVTPEFPQNYFSKHDSTDVVVEDRGTAGVGFEAYLNGSVLGRVADKDGKAFNSIFLHLVEARKTNYVHSTGENGEFEVVGVPPGEYVLYLEMRNRDYNKNKYFYYPGTFKREETSIIKVGLGETVKGLEFVLPEGFNLRTVTGRVMWKDGSPAAKVEVVLLCPHSSDPEGFSIEFRPTTTTTDEQGRFKLEGFTGETYWIEARGSKEGDLDDGFHSPSKKFVLKESISDMRLILSENGYFGAGCPN